MKMGMRKPSVKKSVSARTTGKMKRAVKKSVNPTYGKKGMGMINDPKKSIYNKVYDKSTFDIRDVLTNDEEVDFSESCNNLEPVPEVTISKAANKLYKFLVLPLGVILFILSLALKNWIFAILGLLFVIMSIVVIRASKKSE